MHLRIELGLTSNIINKDKNKLIMFLIKQALMKSDKDYFKKIYKDTLRKDFTYSMFLGDCKFERDVIVLSENIITLNISTFSELEAIMLYNAFLKLKKSKEIISFGVKNNVMILDLFMKNEKNLTCSNVFVKTLSPIAIREKKAGKSSYYHSIENKEGLEILIKNQKYIISQRFPDIKDIDLNIKLVGKNKIVKVKFENVVIPSNICTLQIEGSPLVIDYICKSGLGSKTNAGFGMLKVIGGV